MHAALAEGPHLAHWVARTGDIDAAAARVPDLGVPTPMSRGDFTGASRFPTTAIGRDAAWCPTLIQWPDARHPTDNMPDSGCRLVAVAGEHPEPALVRAELAALGLSDTMKVTYGKSPRIAAMIRTSRGVATL